MLYSLTFHATSGRANVRLDDSVSTVFDVLGDAKSLPATLGVASGLSAMTLVGLSLLFRSRLGFDLRALGEQPALVVRLGRSPAATEAAGLVISNAVIGFGVGLLVCYRRVYDANLLSGLLLSTLGALMLGEAVLRPRTMQGFLLAAGLGSLVSSLLTAIALADWSDRWSAWFSATDTRALMGLLILVSASISARRPGAVIFRSSW